jgi:outer membrane protein assembly factor BamB
MSTAGEMTGFTAEGKMLWQISMMEAYGRLTFPNGRTGAPVIDDDLVITRGITTNWGREGPARDRFYAFDKLTGDLVWSSTPGVGPTDSSFSTPVLAWHNGKRVFYCGTGCGNIVAVNARTGDPLWRYQFLAGGVNSSVLLYKNDTVIAIHGKENLDNSTVGRMIGLSVPDKEFPQAEVLKQDTERWRADVGIFTSSPVLVGERVYQVNHTGELYCLNVNDGNILWKKKLSNSQLHASPLYADGKLYVPMRNGLFYILRPTDDGAEELCKLDLSGKCLGSPSVWNGRIYVHTTRELYCFGKIGDSPSLIGHASKLLRSKENSPSRLQVIPAEVLLRPGQEQSFRLRQIDSHGLTVADMPKDLPAQLVTWEKYIPATAKVKVKMDGQFNEKGVLVAGEENLPSAGAYKAAFLGLSGTVRGRILPKPPFAEDFEAFDLSLLHKSEKDVTFSYPPLSWIGARFKWEVRERDGNKVLSKTLDRALFQRATTFIGHPDLKGYTLSADVMSDGNRRGMSDVGLINQRYLIALKGNQQLLEVSSNHDRLKVGVPFFWDQKKWLHLKTQVDVAQDGSGVVRAKAWEKGQAEPQDWTIEVPHKRAHTHGSPGFFGFSPQSKFRVYIDNIAVEPN